MAAQPYDSTAGLWTAAGNCVGCRRDLGLRRAGRDELTQCHGRCGLGVQIEALSVAASPIGDVVTLTESDYTGTRMREIWANLDPGKAEPIAEIIQLRLEQLDRVVPIESRPGPSLAFWITFGLIGAGLGFAVGWFFVLGFRVAPGFFAAFLLFGLGRLGVIQFLAARRRAWRPRDSGTASSLESC